MPFPKMDLTPLCRLYGINVAVLPKEDQIALQKMSFDKFGTYLFGLLGSADLSDRDFELVGNLSRDVSFFDELKAKPLMKFFQAICVQNVTLNSDLKKLQDVIEKLETMPTRPNSPRTKNSFAKGSKTIDVQINPYCVSLYHFENK